jgi:hypothetical protein
MTDIDKLVEAVARAMIDADCAYADRILEMMGPSYATINPTWETDSELYKTRACAAYRAVLEQLREPNDNMKIEAVRTLGEHMQKLRQHYEAQADRDYGEAKLMPTAALELVSSEETDAVWQAMIDVKLAELDNG